MYLNIVENSVQHFTKIHAFSSVLSIITSTCTMIIIVTANNIIIIAIVVYMLYKMFSKIN